jgi:non-specific serine/threonine protein kinase
VEEIALTDSALTPAEFRERRHRLGLTQRQLAQELGVTETTVARWERGERGLGNGFLVGLALDQIQARRTEIRATTFPAPVTPIIGRAGELAAIRRKIREPGTRVLTLVGPGGAGKTTLALAAASTVAGSRDRGGCLVELARLPAGSPVDATVARSLGVREVGGHTLSQTLARALRSSDALLVLDSCEHVAESVASLVEMLADHCPSVTILATSRTALRIRTENRFAVGPLPVPDPAAGVHRPAALLRVPAVTLFVARWTAVHGGFRLTARDGPAVTQTCCRLDGLPLALELAAATGGAYTLPELLERLTTALQSGQDAPRDLPDRQRGLRAVLDWSYRLLDPRAQEVFRRLAVFTGEFERGCAAWVTAGDTDGVADSSQILDRLVEASLLTTVATAGTGSRLKMFETVRWYAKEKLTDDEFATTARRHTQWLVEWAEHGAPKFYNPGQAAWLDELDVEFGNVRAALAWSRSPAGDAALGLRLAAAVRRYWDMRGLLSEAEHTLGALLDAAPAATPDRMHALIELAGLATRREDVTAMERCGREAVQIAEQIGDLWGLSDALEALTYAAFLRQDPAAASFAARALDCAIRSAQPMAIGQAHMASGVAAFGTGRLEEAIEHLNRALEAARSRGDHWLVGESADVLALVHFARCDYPSARAMGVESLTARVQLRNRAMLPMSLKIVGIADAELGHPTRAATLFGHAAFVEETTGAIPNTHGSDPYRRALANARAALGPNQFQRVWDDGRNAAEADIVAVACRPTAGVAQEGRPVPAADPSGLSDREREVAEFIAQGLTSNAIARRMGIARRTVESHIEHIMIKLGVNSRALIAVWVTTQRLMPGGGAPDLG